MRYSDNASAPSTVTTTIASSDIPGPTVTLTQDYMYAMQSIWTDSGSLGGTVKLQASIDGTNWSDVTGSSQAVSGSGSFLWNVTAAAYKYARTYFTWSAGTGTIKQIFSVKGP